MDLQTLGISKSYNFCFPKCMFTSFWSLSSPSFQLKIRAISRFDPLCWEQFLECLNSSGCCSEHFWPKYGDIVSFVCNSLATDRCRIAAVSAVSSGTVGRVQLRNEFSLENFIAVQSKQIFCNKTRPCTKEWPSPAVVQYFIKSATLLRTSRTEHCVNPSCVTSLDAFLEISSVRKPMKMK